MLEYLELASWSGSVLATAILGSARQAESLSNAVNQKTVSTHCFYRSGEEQAYTSALLHDEIMDSTSKYERARKCLHPYLRLLRVGALVFDG
jgi:hypothetical protein